jgi:hypothetical protein
VSIIELVKQPCGLNPLWSLLLRKIERLDPGMAPVTKDIKRFSPARIDR